MVVGERAFSCVESLNGMLRLWFNTCICASMHKLAKGMLLPFFLQQMTQSMVSGGFWCSAPKGLKQ